MFEQLKNFAHNVQNFNLQALSDTVSSLDKIKVGIPVQMPSTAACTAGYVGSLVGYTATAAGLIYLGLKGGVMLADAISGDSAS